MVSALLNVLKYRLTNESMRMAMSGFSSLRIFCATWLGIYPSSIAFLRMRCLSGSEMSSRSRSECETVLMDTFICEAITFRLTFLTLIRSLLP